MPVTQRNVTTGEWINDALVRPTGGSQKTLAQALKDAADSGPAAPTQVSGPEKTAGTETALRSFSPKDVADMAYTHGPSGGGGGPHAATHAAGGLDAVTLAQSQVTGLTGALAAKANLASPEFTGTPKAPTPPWDSNTTDIATGAYVDQMLIQQYLMIGTNPSTPIALATADKCYLYNLNSGNVTVNGPGQPSAQRYEEHIYGFSASGANRTVTLGTNLETGAGETGVVYDIPQNRTRWFKLILRNGATGLWSEHTGLAPVTSAERTAGTGVIHRSFRPTDVRLMIGAHGVAYTPISTTPTTLAKNTRYVLLPGASEINLPAAGNDGGVIEIINRSGATRTLVPNGAETIENSRTTVDNNDMMALIALNVGSASWVAIPRSV